MGMKCVVATYVFTCDEGKVLDRDMMENVMVLNNAHFSEDGTSVNFTVYDDNIVEKAQKLRGQLFYAQVEDKK